MRISRKSRKKYAGVDIYHGNLPLSVEEVQNYLGVSRATAYRIGLWYINARDVCNGPVRSLECYDFNFIARAVKSSLKKRERLFVNDLVGYYFASDYKLGTRYFGSWKLMEEEAKKFLGRKSLKRVKSLRVSDLSELVDKQKKKKCYVWFPYLRREFEIASKNLSRVLERPVFIVGDPPKVDFNKVDVYVLDYFSKYFSRSLSIERESGADRILKNLRHEDLFSEVLLHDSVDSAP